MYKSITCGDKTVLLKYGAKAQITIEQQAARKIGEAGLKLINARSGFQLGLKDKMPLDLAIGFVDSDMEFLLWLWGMGLAWKDSGAKPEDAADLYDAFMEDQPELDAGERLKEFKMAAIDAIGMARGLDPKKAADQNKKDREEDRTLELKRIYKAQALAKAEIAAEKDGTGIEPGETV
jgi:hypothetical protein